MTWLQENPEAADTIEKALRDKLLAKPKKRGDKSEEAEVPAEAVAEAK